VDAMAGGLKLGRSLAAAGRTLPNAAAVGTHGPICQGAPRALCNARTFGPFPSLVRNDVAYCSERIGPRATLRADTLFTASSTNTRELWDTHR